MFFDVSDPLQYAPDTDTRKISEYGIRNINKTLKTWVYLNNTSINKLIRFIFNKADTVVKVMFRGRVLWNSVFQLFCYGNSAEMYSFLSW